MDKELGPYLIIAVIALFVVFIIVVGIVLPSYLRKAMSKKDDKK